MGVRKKIKLRVCKWDEVYGQMPVDEAFDAAKKAHLDCFAHEAKNATKEEFLSATRALGIRKVEDLWRTIEKKDPVADKTDEDEVDNWPVTNRLLFPEYSQAVNDAMQAVAEWARNMFSKEVLGFDPR